MANDYNRDKHDLGSVTVPGARQGTQKQAVLKRVPRDVFRRSVGHGDAAGGSGQYNGVGGTGDPTITYVPKPYMFSWMKYSYNMADFLDEY